MEYQSYGYDFGELPIEVSWSVLLNNFSVKKKSPKKSQGQRICKVAGIGRVFVFCGIDIFYALKITNKEKTAIFLSAVPSYLITTFSHFFEISIRYLFICEASLLYVLSLLYVMKSDNNKIIFQSYGFFI